MKLKWQWFLGGKVMFWLSIVVFIVFIFVFVFTYIIDLTTLTSGKIQNIDDASIKTISEEYVAKLGITVDRPIVYKFIQYYCNDGSEEILLGTFHEWKNTYYIQISINLCHNPKELEEIVIHETRHMLVEYLKDKKIINLSKYSEDIARQNNEACNNLFNSGIDLLKNKEDK